MKLVQMKDTAIKVRRSEAFALFDFLITLADGTEAIVTLDMESTIYVLENLDEGQGVFDKVKCGWFGRWLGKFKSRSPRAKS